MEPLERRAVDRRKTLLGGIIVHGASGLTLDCTVRNLSDAGALVGIRSAEHLTSPIALLVPAMDQAFEAIVKWGVRANLGLSFVRALSLDDPQSDLEKTIWRLWRERRAR